MERFIDQANQYYFRHGSADIRKVPTPTKVFKKVKERIKDGIFLKGEWVDYIGVCNGRAVAFEAKETRERTRFDLMQNLHEHQFELLKSWHLKGAKTFIVICFIKHGYETYILPFEQLENFYNDARNGGRQSIPYQYFLQHCEMIKPYKGIKLHYLKGLINGAESLC